MQLHKNKMSADRIRPAISNPGKMNFYEAAIVAIKQQPHYPKDWQLNRIIAARHFIVANCCGDINQDAIAVRACLSKFHFSRLFKQGYGQTPHQYLTSVRLTKAKLLLQSGHTVRDTALLLGFTSITSFTGLFKSRTGSTPTNYRQKKQFSRALVV